MILQEPLMPKFFFKEDITRFGFWGYFTSAKSVKKQKEKT